MSAAQRVVITGGIGSGKSLVSSFLMARGWPANDADMIGHQALATPEAFAEVSRTWPQVVVEGTVDRLLLANLVFSDPRHLRRLESVLHPLIKQRIDDWIHATPAPTVLEVSVPSMIAARWGIVVVVDAPEAVRLERAVARGMGASDVKARMAAQPSRQEYLRLADIVLPNTGSPAQLETATEAVAARIMST